MIDLRDGRSPGRVPEYVGTTFQSRLRYRERNAGIVSAAQLRTPEDRARQYRLLREMTGRTPLLSADTVNGGMVMAKVLSQNPTESHYDPAYIDTLQRLEADGIVQPGDELLEITSGSAGTSFGWAANRLGYKAHILVPPELPQGRVQEMINFGAQVERSKPGYVPQTADEMREMILASRRDGYKIERHFTDDYKVITLEKDGHRICVVNHSANRLTIDAFREIGTEVADVLPEDVQIDFAISVLGNWTTTTGVSETLRERFPEVKVIGLEDVRNPVYFDAKYPRRYEDLYGIGPTFGQHDSYGASAKGVRLDFADVEKVDDIALIGPSARDLTREQFNRGQTIATTIGNTSAAGLSVARGIAEVHPGSNIVIFFYDKADRYGLPIPAYNPEAHSASMYEAVRYHDANEGNRLEPNVLQPFGWRQPQVHTVYELPKTLREAYVKGME